MLLQNWIHRIEEGQGPRLLKPVLLILVLATLLLGYNLRGFKNMSTPDAMDAAQLARNLAEHKGFTTSFVRPFSLYLLQRADADRYGTPKLGDTRDRGQIRDNRHPDLANPPVYPLMLAGLMKASPKFRYQVAGSVKALNHGGNFYIYGPDFLIGAFNQVLFLIAVVVVFFLARRMFDPTIAWTSAAIFLCTDLFWRFSISGLSTMLLILIFIALACGVTLLDQITREQKYGPPAQVSLAVIIGLIVGIGCLTRYSFGWLILPVLLFLGFFAGQNRVILCVAALAAFTLAVSPWVARNYHVSHTPFGVAGYAMYENTTYFPESRLERSLAPDLSRVRYDQIWSKFIGNFQTAFQEDLPKLGGSWISAFFLVGLLVPLTNPALNRLRYFLLFCLPFLMAAQSLGKTSQTDDNPVLNSENLLVIVAPLVIIFGIKLFYLLLDQLALPLLQFRYLVIGIFCCIICLPTILNFVSPRTNAIAYPPYHPFVIQQASNWMNDNELIMSDVPWAIAWYGKRQSIWLTLNAQEDFFKINDYQKPVRAVYLTPLTMDARFLTGWIRPSEHSWGSFALESMMKGEVPIYFPLRKVPGGYLPEQLFLTDTERWNRSANNPAPTAPAVPASPAAPVTPTR